MVLREILENGAYREDFYEEWPLQIKSSTFTHT